MNDTEIGSALKELQRYGTPRLACMTDGEWHANIDIFITGQGISFKIASEFNHPTPEAAMHELKQRVQTSLTELKNKPLIES